MMALRRSAVRMIAGIERNFAPEPCVLRSTAISAQMENFPFSAIGAPLKGVGQQRSDTTFKPPRVNDRVLSVRDVPSSDSRHALVAWQSGWKSLQVVVR